MGQEHRGVKFDSILSKLIVNKANRERKKIAAAVGVSVPMITQYVRGNSKPSFDVLVKLAAFFDVSLDYLVFGEQDQAETSTTDYGPVFRYMDDTLAKLRARTDQQSAMVARVARVLADHINKLGEQLVKESAQMAGLMLDEETLRLESFSLETWIMSMNLQYDIIEVGAGDTPAAGRFMPVVAENLAKERRYRFLLPQGLREWKPLVEKYSSMLQHFCRNNARPIHENCEFRVTRSEVCATSGLGLYRVDVARLKEEDAGLYELVGSMIDHDGWVGYVIPPSDTVQADMLMDQFHLQNAKKAFERMWKAGKHP
jgi:transcriptional regulator with XRE-family HTH domain